MEIQLSDHFNYRKLLKFTFPSIIMMIFTSIYGVVDGLFVSNFVGKTGFTAVNFVMPLIMILGSAGFMFGSGGSAIIAKTMGAGQLEKAQKQFSLIVYASAAVGIILAVLGLIFLRPLMIMMGAEGEMLEQGMVYGRICLMGIPAYVLQYGFQSFFITAEKPDMGLKVTVIAGVTNMVLDALLTAVIPLGVAGAATATSISQYIGAIIPLFYFGRKNSSSLRLTGTKFEGKILLDTCILGSSQLLSNVATSIVSILYNMQLLKYAGNDGVAAYGVLMYVNMIFLAIFMGYSMGSAPIVSFHYGAGNTDELKSLKKKSYVIVGIFSVIMFVAGEVLARPLSMIFVSYDADLLDLTVRAFWIYSFSFLFSGFGIWGSGFFTALNDGLVAAINSVLRTVVFQVAAVLIFPLFWGIDGIWISCVVAELLAAVVAIVCIILFKKKYNY